MVTPSQAGRFKPRRPAKKIRPPDASGSGAVDGGESGARTSFQGRGRTGRGRGRDAGRDGFGRGRGGRFMLPQGQAFFGNNNVAEPTGRKPSIASQNPAQRGIGSRDGAISGKATKRQEVTEAAGGEEIVGMLEEGIGSSSVPTTVVSSSSYVKKSDAATTAFERALMGEDQRGAFLKFSLAGGDSYDSDTSGEEAPKSLQKPRSRKEQYKPPLSLPLPVQKIPAGAGGTGRVHRNDVDSMHQNRNLEPLKRPEYKSPFIPPDDEEGFKAEKRNLFLVQLPTRLPPLTFAQNVRENSGAPEASGEELSPVATPSLQPSAFDNTLTSAVPGRLGKIKVYKSGKTVLVLESPSGDPAIEMTVSEGLTCGFKQFAVSIDLDSGSFIPIGSIEKTVVGTPDLCRLGSQA